MIVRTVVAIVLAAALPGLAELTGLWTGYTISHPWWSMPAVGRGIAIGVIIAALGLWLQFKTTAGGRSVGVIFALAVAATAAATWYGRQVFVGSEEFVPWAGQLWHFGFTGFIAAVTALFSLIFSRFFRKPNPRST